MLIKNIVTIYEKEKTEFYIVFGISDNEYFYLKEELNIQRLADYMTQKLGSSKASNDSDNKKELNLYYRIKFYPTSEIISEM